THDTPDTTDHATQVDHDRTVDYLPGDNGAGQLIATGPADAIRALYTKLGQAARTPANDTDHRTLDQRRFDALTDATIHHPDTTPVDPQTCRLHVTVPA